MQKIYFIVIMLLSVMANAQQRTFTKSVRTDYATKQVTFNISWAAGSRGVSGENTYNSKVWVLVDYQEIRGGVPYGSWQRATMDLTKLPTDCTADGANTKGCWYQGQATAAQNASITVTLTNVPAQFRWCAFASDCPPQMIVNSATNIQLKGTSPFTIKYADNTTDIVTVKTYSLRTGKTLVSISDTTKAPGVIQCLTRDQIAINNYCCSGQTLVNGYCRDLIADQATVMSCNSTELEIKLTDPGVKTWDSYQCPNGWRLPKNTELNCMWTNRTALSLKYDHGYWGSEQSGWTNPTNYTYSCHWPHGGDCSSANAHIWLQTFPTDECGGAYRYQGYLSLWCNNQKDGYHRCLR